MATASQTQELQDWRRTNGRDTRSDARCAEAYWPSPYLVIRWTPEWHGTAEIRIIACDDGDAETENSITVVDREYRQGDPIDGSLRQRIVDAAVVISRRTRLRLCVVFGDSDAVYVEPNGRAIRCTHVPTDGRWLRGMKRSRSGL